MCESRLNLSMKARPVATRRALIEKVQECMTLANACASGTEDVSNSLRRMGADLIKRLARVEKAVHCEKARLTQTRIELEQAALLASLTELPFWERQGWFWAGRRPRPQKQDERLQQADEPSAPVDVGINPMEML